MATRHRFVLTAQSAEPSALFDPGDRVLVLTGSDLTARANALFVLIEAPEAARAQIRQVLTSAFGRGGLADDLKAEEAREFLTHLLNRLAVTTDGHEAVVVAALWDRQGAVVAAVGGGSAYLCRETATRRPAAVISEAGRGARVARIALQPGDRIVLGSSDLTRALMPGEVPQIVDSYPTLSGACTWLATLAASRSKRLATVLLVQPEVGRVGVDAAQRSARALARSRLDRRLVLLPIALLALVIAGLLAHPALGQLKNAPPSAVPRGLHNVTVAPANSRLPTAVSLSSRAATLPAMINLSARLSYPARTEARAVLCWKTRLMGQRFDLWIGGGPHRVLPGASLLFGPGGSRCTIEMLPRSPHTGRYAWRLAERKSGYAERVSAWGSFWVRAVEPRHSATPKRPLRSVPSGPQPALPALTPFPTAPPAPAVAPVPTPVVQRPAPVYQAPQPVYHPPAPAPAPRPPAAPAPVAPKPAPAKPASKAPPAVVPCPNPPLCS